MFSCARSGSGEKRSFTQLLFRGRGKGNTTPKGSAPAARSDIDNDQTINLTPRSDVCEHTAVLPIVSQEAAILFPVAADPAQRTPRSARSDRHVRDVQLQRDQNTASSQKALAASTFSKPLQSQEVTTPVKASPRLRSGHNTPRVKAVLPEGNLQQLESDYQDLQAQFHALRSSPHWKQAPAAGEFAATGVSPRNRTPSRVSPSPRTARTGTPVKRATVSRAADRTSRHGPAGSAKTATPRRAETGRNASPAPSLTKHSSPRAAADLEMDVATSQASMDSSQASLRLPMPPFAASNMSVRGSFAAANRHTSPASLLPTAPASTTSAPTPINTRQSMIPTLTGIPGARSDASGMGLNLRLAQGESLGLTKAPPAVNASIATAPSAVQRTYTGVSDVPTEDTDVAFELPAHGLQTTDFIIQHKEPSKRAVNMPKQPPCVITAEAVHSKRHSFKWGGLAGKVKAIFKSNKH